ncbi:rubrerythrin family protein [Anoxybacillus ayderensis]|uniref:ferritin-like domain-containing protein n=1 Tax=Anoxybacillus sp. ST70 TaxID=2864180 RepID=UPI0002D910CA|nr:ferritin-like domain-containing protein [Anoxybacillus sp. ST70]AXM90356.1 rubrerythrin family protein [Anoxybacillus ayderensis G10]MBW9218291.1 ferritin-like domain-containing protein [Anoxybacillus sp. ST70]THD17457.1 rubrerythrin family protein [Anoxybacillus ayderensis]
MNGYVYSDTRFMKDLEKAINGEYSAIHCYAQLAHLAEKENMRKQILEIRQDEIKHFQQFEHIYFSLTGKRPQPKMSEKCPDDFKRGLEIALQDEQQTVDFYLEIADYITIPFIKETFRRAAADEQNHAIWFLYYFLKEKS